MMVLRQKGGIFVTTGTAGNSKFLTELLNGVIASLKMIVPSHPKVKKPRLLKEDLSLQYGVLIGYAGDVKGNLIVRGVPTVFSKIGEKMFGMPLEGEMLRSFTGEFGNMLGGSLATMMSHQGIESDITAPTILQGESTLSGFDQSIILSVSYEELGEIDIVVMMNQ